MLFEMSRSICHLLSIIKSYNCVTILFCCWPINMSTCACRILCSTRHFGNFEIKKKRSLFLPHVFASKWHQVLSTWQDTLDLPTYQSHATHCTYKIKCLLLFTVSWQWAIHSGLYISGSDEVCLQLHKLYTRYQRLFGMYCIQFI